MKKQLLLPIFAASNLLVLSATGQTIVDFDSSGDLTSSFRELRSNANESFQSGAGSDGSTAGFFRYTDAADNGALRYVYDANGATSGTSTFTSGSVAMDVRFNNANTLMGLSFGPSTTDTLGWRFRVDNSGAVDNSVTVAAVNQTNNFSIGTTLTTTSSPSITLNSGVALNAGSTNVFPTTTLTTGGWYRMRLDFSLDGSSNRVLGISVWDNITETGLPKFTQNLTVSGSTYTGAGEVGFWTAGYATAGTLSVDVDNFTVVPEPSTEALIGLGLAGLCLLRRRRSL